MDDGPGRLRWGIGQRLEFIEFRLFWDGQINRSHLQKRFAISTPQASADIARYLSLAPQNVRYDPHQKAYVARPGFNPILYVPSARQYLADLRAIADDAVDQERTWLGMVPDFAVVPTIRRRLEAPRLRSILEAIRNRLAVLVLYQSFTREAPTHRWLTPHALGFDGRRWHMRAWCDERKTFLDFVLARMLEVTETRLHPINPQHDLEWVRPITMRIGPHPDLEDAQRRIIELDYGMEDGALEVTLRMRMAYYLERNLLLDEEASRLAPERVQLALLNRDEVAAARTATEDEQADINELIATAADAAA